MLAHGFRKFHYRRLRHHCFFALHAMRQHMAQRAPCAPLTAREKQRMRPKHSRMLFIIGSLVLMGLSAALVLRSLDDTIIFFYTPTQLTKKKQEPDFDVKRPLRIGGLVKKGSVTNIPSGGIHFAITDMKNNLNVTYHGLVPSLFRDNQGVVAQGILSDNGELIAQTILAKHDEAYMPRAVIDELKSSGRWREGAGYVKPTP
jgi:cytochrome c-type biogenesis protein CcmE